MFERIGPLCGNGIDPRKQRAAMEPLEEFPKRGFFSLGSDAHRTVGKIPNSAGQSERAGVPACEIAEHHHLHAAGYFRFQMPHEK